MDNYLVQKKGVSGIPLACIVQDMVGLPQVDPGYCLPTVSEEMISPVPHIGTEYQEDNNTVWQVI
jgi:hypothetical protein